MNLKKIFFLLIVISLISITYGLSVEKEGDIPNRATNLSSRQKKDASEAIAQLEYSKIFYNSAGTIANHGSIRIDMQGIFTHFGTRYHNIQAQINGIKGSSTVAHVSVSEESMSTKTSEQKHVVRKVRNALLESLKSGKSYRVKGKA
ncbi:hypothetical protein DICPUDRAFT_91531 [Dictyostelium purpureum]|uniref:FTP domain-containing protein n=1 Tax=Dictyostelium purpureum TaxID=5786 RepID=F0ZDU2_DICPU|nr:uncharacterized protein DICPUDRAFT_91531 [Dictyostelium purpureum]EGC37927.1 hypothetical protein DICPUDRAFT_91531 [Dictyostelium purpureum]|eukprot:XP_003285587.1 hypothetical protein DICPUDRAFT_91531 [Dictyostelium purpureum]